MAHILHLDAWRRLTEASTTAVMESNVKPSIPGDARRRGTHFLSFFPLVPERRGKLCIMEVTRPTLPSTLSDPALFSSPLYSLIPSPHLLPQESTS